MSKTHFYVFGKIQPKQRARVLKSGRSYTPKKTVDYEEKIKAAYLEENKLKKHYRGGVSLSIGAYFAMPKSWSLAKKKKMAMEPHLQRPDLDNIFKVVKDALNKIAYADDSQIYSYEYSEKCWAEPRDITDIDISDERICVELTYDE